MVSGLENSVRKPDFAPQFCSTSLSTVPVILMFIVSSSQDGCCSSGHHNFPLCLRAGKWMKGSFFFLRLFLSEELVLEEMPSLAVLLLQLTGFF